MINYYLLPCNCGRKIPVQPRQAGEILTCACGASLEVPTLSGIKVLERTDVVAEPKPTTPKTAWNTGHRLIFLGVLVIVATMAIGGWLFWVRPTDPYANFTPEQMRKVPDILTPSANWRFWLSLERSGLDRRKRGAEIWFAEQQTQHLIYWVLLGLVAGTGLALVAGGIIVVDLRKKRTGNSGQRNK